jgi:hypothetical protein
MTARSMGAVGVQQVGRGLLRVLHVPLAKSSAIIIKTRELMQGVKDRSAGMARGGYVGKTGRPANIAKSLLIFLLGSTKLILQITKKHAAKNSKLEMQRCNKKMFIFEKEEGARMERADRI